MHVVPRLVLLSVTCIVMPFWVLIPMIQHALCQARSCPTSQNVQPINGPLLLLLLLLLLLCLRCLLLLLTCLLLLLINLVDARGTQPT